MSGVDDEVSADGAGEQQRSAVVTGAARGIGAAVARRLAADGLAVTLADLPSAAEALDAVVAGLASRGLVARAAHVDVTDADAVDALVAEHAAAFGGIDVVVANAGIAVTAALLEATDADFERVLRVNVLGVFHCYRAAARAMVAQGRGGRIIGAASVAAHRGGALQGAYSASKFAVRGMSQSYAQELAEHGITVNVYSPGVVATPMWEGIDADLASRRGTAVGSEVAAMVAQIPLGRLEVPDDVAGVVSFLASSDAGYVTGQSIVVDGGMWFS